MEAEKTTRLNAARTRFSGFAGNWQDYVIYAMFIALFIFFSIVLRDRGFLTSSNIMNIVRQTAMVSIMAVGMTFVLSSAEIDLSFGSTVALAALSAALLLRLTDSVLLAVVAGLGAGAVVGFINGLFVTQIGIPSFLMTLGMMGIVVGVARWMTNLQSIPVSNETFAFIFGSGDIGPVPVLLIWMVVVAVVGELSLKKTVFGRKVLATGGNKISALYSGVSVTRTKWTVLIINGMLAGLAGMLYAGRLYGARYTLGENDLLTVIAAVIIGGTSLFGGKGTVLGSVVGALIMGMVNNGLILMGLSVDQQMIFRGIIIISAVAIMTSRTKKS